MQDGFSSASEMADKIAAENKQKADDAIKAEVENNKSDEDKAKDAQAAIDAKKIEDDANATKLAQEQADAAEVKRLEDLSKTSGKPIDDIKKEEAAVAAKAKEDEAKKADENKEQVDPIADLLKELKFGSKEELVKHLQKKDEKQKSPEEIKREEEVYSANMNAFAVENNLMSLEDINRLNSVKGENDKDLVYKKFAAEAKEEILDEFEEEYEPTEEDILGKINEAFEKEYPLNSKNKNAATRAGNKIKAEAELIRQPLEKKYEKAKTEYDSQVNIRNNYPEYQKTMKGIFESAVPKKVSFYSGKDGDQDFSIDVELSADDQKEILEKVRKKYEVPETYILHQKGKTEEIQKMIQEDVEFLVGKKTEAEAKLKLADKFEKIGYGKGSKVGAEQSFETNQSKKNAEQKDTNTKLTGQEAINAAIQSTRVKK